MSASAPTPPRNARSWRFAARVLVKAALLFVFVNAAFALIKPMPFLEGLSLYNSLFPGRLRLPYGDSPSSDYNLSPFNLEAMIASHEIAGAHPAANEYRVLLLGDSSVWGFLLPADQTLAAHLSAAGFTTATGRPLRVFNLGYPIMSLTKDLLLLDLTMRFQPDLVVWMVTLESLPYEKQLYPPLLQHNADRLRPLIEDFGLALDPADPRLIDPAFWDETLVGQRRGLADLLRLQLYGVLWAATGIDQDIPASYTPRMEDLAADATFQGFGPGEMTADDLAFDVLAAGVERAGATAVLIVNEPMFVSQGVNSDIRYNFYYPRWAYDGYRQWLAERCETEGWHCIDLWQVVPASEFTDSAIHYTPYGARMLAEQLGAEIVRLADDAQ